MSKPKFSVPGWVPVVLFATLIIVHQYLPDGAILWLRFVGVSMLALAAVFMFLPFIQLSKYGGADKNKGYMETTVVADRGVYAIVRHPQYLGYMLLYAGFALLSQHWVTLLIAAVGIAVFYMQALTEERLCQDKFGSTYDKYMLRVPRFNLILGLWRYLKR